MVGGKPCVRSTTIPGLLIIDLEVHSDERGCFTENWQRAKMNGLGLPQFQPVQQNVSHNTWAGVTRGLHAEPWEKLVSVVSGRAFGAWVDLREGETFGTSVTGELVPGTAIFVPRGVANGYQTLTDGTVYSYLVNDHWSADARDKYAYVNVADKALQIEWPIPLGRAILSEADHHHPPLAEARKVASRRTVVLGSGGQLGRALAHSLPEAVLLDRDSLDLTVPEQIESFDWNSVGTIINASGFTAVDTAETPAGRHAAWAVNVDGVARLCRIAEHHGITLVHVSTDYVFDGRLEVHDETETPSPLGVYGQTKAAGDYLVGQLSHHYVVRTSWVIGDGLNFVRTMADLARRGTSPAVVNDQRGRLTFAEDLAAGIRHLLRSGAPFGTYNLTNSGPVQSWSDIAADVFELCGRARSDVSPISTAQWMAQQPDGPSAPRPTHSALSLDRIEAAGFFPPAASSRLTTWMASHRAT